MTDNFIARLQEGLQLEIYEKENPNRHEGLSLKIHSPGTGKL